MSEQQPKRTQKAILDAARAKRQAILDLLNERGPMTYRDIRAALNANDNLSCILNVMRDRGELGQEGSGRHSMKWRALVKESGRVTLGPVPSGRRNEPEPMPSKHARVVRLLDRQNYSSGGQCANVRRSYLQSSLG